MSTPLTILHGGRRKVVRISANESMSAVLRMACTEFGLDSSAPLILKHKRNVVDLSQSFRFTGIPQNATLEIEEHGTSRTRGAAGSSAAGRGQVRVAMRLPGGRRVQAFFPAETTLAGLLRSWADGGEIDPGVLHQGPSLQFMRRAYSESEIESTTLRSIGLSTGSAMFTLSLSSPSATSNVPSAPAAAKVAAAGSEADSSKVSQDQADIDRAIALSLAESAKPRGNAATEHTTKRVDDPAPTVTPAPGRQSSMPPTPPTHPSVPTPTPTAEAAAVADLDGGHSEEMAVESHPTSEDAGSTVPKDGGVSVSKGAVGAAGSEPDEMEIGETREPDPPSMGISVCAAALEAMVAGHFDADSSACVLTLAKIVDNIVYRPDDAKTRQIRCANATFQQKVGRIRGGIDFLEGIGFVTKSEDSTPSSFAIGSRGNVGGRLLVLPDDREDHALLKEARGLLEKQAEDLGVPRNKMPQPPRPRPSPTVAATDRQGTTFDPYKPFISSTTPTPKGQEEQSLTEKRLQALLEKRANVVAGGAPERNIQVTLPSRAAASPSVSEEAGKRGGGGGGEVSAMEGVTTEETAGDRALIAKKAARQMAERKKLEDTPFQTKAMREIQRLQKATVYRTSIIKIQFPDRVVLQATFSSTEGVKDLVRLVRESFGESYRERKFELYVSPPRMVLKEASSLSEAGLVPAALVYVSWKDMPPSGEAEGAYLKTELVGSGEGGSSVARPVGVSLEAGGGGAAASKFGAGSRAAGSGGRASAGAKGSGSGGGGKKKPSWLKIN